MDWNWGEEKKGKDSWSRWNIRLLRGCPQRSKQCRQNELQLLIKLAVEECETEEAVEGLSLQKNGWVFTMLTKRK